ncbi:MAG: DUF4398 domain-containing protein [Deltaproteobacteria bacterium]|nr:DUF4398 domain-containing protein [Deltaproteobacteria bacterium]
MMPNIKSESAFVTATVLTLGIALGCAHVPLNDKRAVSSIGIAQEAGADEIPRASVHLNLAKRELKEARILSENGHCGRANSLLMRAEVDGAMALALFRESAEKAAAANARQRVMQLQKQSD